MSIGEKIKHIREAAGLSQKEVTGKADLTASYLANLESDRIKTPSPDKVKRIAFALKTTWEELVLGTEVEGEFVEGEQQSRLVWCGNRYCPSANNRPRKRIIAPCVETWMDNGSDGMYREYGVETFASFPAFNERGEKNLYCPSCGTALITECACGREISSGAHKYCTGCGGPLWPKLDVVLPNDEVLHEDDVPF